MARSHQAAATAVSLRQAETVLRTMSEELVRHQHVLKVLVPRYAPMADGRLWLGLVLDDDKLINEFNAYLGNAATQLSQLGTAILPTHNLFLVALPTRIRRSHLRAFSSSVRRGLAHPQEIVEP